MARQPQPKTRIIVLDTEYLLELFGVPGHSNRSSMERVENKFKEAVREGHLLFVPMPCLFELGNHVAQVEDGTIRRKRAQDVEKMVKSSLQQSTPWTIVPTKEIGLHDQLLRSLRRFAREFAGQGIGLTDTFVAEEAKRLREKYPGGSYSVHIWTTDTALKAREPDKEADPFPAY